MLSSASCYLYLDAKCSDYPLNKRLGGPELFWPFFRRRKCLLVPEGIEQRLLRRAASRLIIVTAAMSQQYPLSSCHHSPLLAVSCPHISLFMTQHTSCRISRNQIITFIIITFMLLNITLPNVTNNLTHRSVIFSAIASCPVETVASVKFIVPWLIASSKSGVSSIGFNKIP